MNENIFKASIGIVAAFFTVYFCWKVIPPFLEHPDLIGAFGAGFVNPFAAGYSTDAICCWFILVIWILYERPKVKHGWICVLLGIIPGVAVGFALYLVLRMKSLTI